MIKIKICKLKWRFLMNKLNCEDKKIVLFRRLLLQQLLAGWAGTVDLLLQRQHALLFPFGCSVSQLRSTVALFVLREAFQKVHTSTEREENQPELKMSVLRRKQNYKLRLQCCPVSSTLKRLN